MTITTTKEARSRGLVPLTTAYTLPDEQWMINAVIHDMQRGQTEHAVVHAALGAEVWRASKGFKKHL